MVSPPTRAGAVGFAGTVATEATVGLERATAAIRSTADNAVAAIPWDIVPLAVDLGGSL